MNRSLHLNPAIVIAVPFLFQRHDLLRGGVGVKAVVIFKHRNGTGDIALDAHIGHTLADVVGEIIHVRYGGGAKPQAFGQTQQGCCPNGPAVPEILLGENVIGEPVL